MELAISRPSSSGERHHANRTTFPDTAFNKRTRNRMRQTELHLLIEALETLRRKHRMITDCLFECVVLDAITIKNVALAQQLDAPAVERIL
jgi:hypothetical protein